MRDITIREANHADLPAIVALLADDPLGQKRELPVLPLDVRYLQAFDEIVADPAQWLMVATAAGVVVGCLQLTVIPGLSRLGARRALIEGVRVAASCRGQGIGERMIAWARIQAVQSGCSILQLTTDRTRKDAHRFYQHMGFSPSHLGMKRELLPGGGD